MANGPLSSREVIEPVDNVSVGPTFRSSVPAEQFKYGVIQHTSNTRAGGTCVRSDGNVSGMLSESSQHGTNDSVISSTSGNMEIDRTERRECHNHLSESQLSSNEDHQKSIGTRQRSSKSGDETTNAQKSNGINLVSSSEKDDNGNNRRRKRNEDDDKREGEGGDGGFSGEIALITNDDSSPPHKRQKSDHNPRSDGCIGNSSRIGLFEGSEQRGCTTGEASGSFNAKSTSASKSNESQVSSEAQLVRSLGLRSSVTIPENVINAYNAADEYIKKLNRISQLKESFAKSRADYMNGRLNSDVDDEQIVDFNALASARRDDGAILAYALTLFVFLGTRRVVCQRIDYYNAKLLFVVTREGSDEVDRLLLDDAFRDMFKAEPEYERKCRMEKIKVQTSHLNRLRVVTEQSQKNGGKGEFVMILKGVKKTFLQDKETNEIKDMYEPILAFEPIVKKVDDLDHTDNDY